MQVYERQLKQQTSELCNLIINLSGCAFVTIKLLFKNKMLSLKIHSYRLRNRQTKKEMGLRVI